MAQKEKEKKRKKNNTKYSGHFVSLQRLRVAHALQNNLLLILSTGRSKIVLISQTMGVALDMQGKPNHKTKTSCFEKDPL